VLEAVRKSGDYAWQHAGPTCRFNRMVGGWLGVLGF